MMKIVFACGGFLLVAMGVGSLAAGLWTHNQHNELVGYSTIIVGLLIGRDR